MKQFNLLMILLISLTVSSCGTRQERAERLIKRAQNLYPIDSLVSEKIIIDTLLVYDTTVVVEKDSVLVIIPSVNPETNEKITYNKKILLDNERARITATTNSKGGIDLYINFKEKKIQVKGTVKYNKEIITKKQLITIHKDRPREFFWWVGLFFSITFILIITFFIIKLIKSKLP